MKTIVILGGNGMIGKSLIKYILKHPPSCEYRILSVDSTYDHSIRSPAENIAYYSFDVLLDDFVDQLGLLKLGHQICILNLIAKDYPVTPQGLSSEYKSPFGLPLGTYIDSLAVTTGSAYNIFHLLDHHQLLSCSVILVGSIYAHVLPNPLLYSSSQSIYKPIAYPSGKAAQIPLLKQASRYLAQFGGRCNCISFGGIEADQAQSFKQAYSALSPQNSMVPINDALIVLKWLIFEAPQSLNGSEVMVDGGFTCI